MALAASLRSRPSQVQRQTARLGLTTEIKTSLQFLALAGLKLERELASQLETNPFLTVASTHSRHDQGDWLAQMAAPTAQTLHAALRLMARDLFWQPKDRAVANALIDEVADSGLLTAPLADLDLPVEAAAARRVQQVFVQENGLLADDLGMCFLAQIEDPSPEEKLICADLSKLASADPETLGKFAALSRRPADFLDLEQPLILPPDLILTRADGGGWRAQLNPLMHRRYDIDDEALASLSPVALAKPEITEPLRAAKATVRGLKARSQTLTRLAAYLADQQHGALTSDGPGFVPKPLSQAEVAQALDLHPSTISRACRDKTVETPKGVIAIGAFFSNPVDGAGRLSGAQLRHHIAVAIAEETRPLSDQALAQVLGDQGYVLARRTITKHRLRLNIPNTAVRKAARSGIVGAGAAGLRPKI